MGLREERFGRTRGWRETVERSSRSLQGQPGPHATPQAADLYTRVGRVSNASGRPERVAATPSGGSPGPVDTDTNPATGDLFDSLRKLMALPRFGTADEIAVLVAYLAGPEAGFITGASLTIDGGFTA